MGANKRVIAQSAGFSIFIKLDIKWCCSWAFWIFSSYNFIWKTIIYRYLDFDAPCPTVTCDLIGEWSGRENDWVPADEDPLRLDKSWSAKNIACKKINDYERKK